jgi:nucleotidyltransferase substrate binding protein (TIGR01987 family)
LVQAFEFTHELAWNVLKDFLEERGTTNLFGYKDATRQACAAALITAGEVWMAMIDSRNRTTHTYDQKVADEIAAAIKTKYVTGFAEFQKRIEALEKQPP